MTNVRPTRRPLVSRKLLDPVSLISTFGCLVVLAPFFVPATASVAAAPADSCTTLLAKTQAFSDAGQQNDGEAVAKMLTDEVLFFNEGGEQATKQEMASARRGPPAADIKVTMAVTDWRCRVYGDTAVASFIDVRSEVNHGEASTIRYRSVETWHREGVDWRIVGSETIALVDDPPAVMLPTRLLDEYVGTYVDREGRSFAFTRTDSGIAASLDGGPAKVQSAEVTDVLFTPGRYRQRKVFERDVAGKVIAFNLRQEGYDRHFRRV